MPDSPYLHYFIEIQLCSTSQSLVFPVANASWGRFKRALSSKQEGFFIFATTDGRTLALNLKHIQYANACKRIAAEEKNNIVGDSVVTLYYSNRVILEQAKDPMHLARIFSALKSCLGDETFNFINLDKKIVMFRIGELSLFEASTVFVEEGFKQIYFQNWGEFPPSS